MNLITNLDLEEGLKLLEEGVRLHNSATKNLTGKPKQALKRGLKEPLNIIKRGKFFVDKLAVIKFTKTISRY